MANMWMSESTSVELAVSIFCELQGSDSDQLAHGAANNSPLGSQLTTMASEPGKNWIFEPRLASNLLGS